MDECNANDDHKSRRYRIGCQHEPRKTQTTEKEEQRELEAWQEGEVAMVQQASQAAKFLRRFLIAFLVVSSTLNPLPRNHGRASEWKTERRN